MKLFLFIFFSFNFLLIKNSSPLFQDNLFTKIYEKNKDKNIMISPLGLYQIMGILANGAVGKTQTEILETLFPNQKVISNYNILSKINNNLSQILALLSLESNIQQKNDIDKYFDCKGDCNLIFNNVNGLFVKKGYQLTDEFLSFCETYNISFSELIDAKQINHFCDVNTNGKIKEIIDKIDNNIILILINAIYFKGSWFEPFKEYNTKKLPFHNSNNNFVEVDIMYQLYDNIMYYEDDDVQMISLPYKSERLNSKMVIILPNKDKYSNFPLNYLKNKNLNEIISKLRWTENVHLYLPKFDYEFNVNLNEILKSIGMKIGFSGEADFSKIFKITNAKIDKIIQKTFIKIDEEGTEAAAITMVMMVESALELEKNKKEYYMYVNHSFIYAIISDDIKDIEGNYLMPFIGVVNNLEGNISKRNESLSLKKNILNNDNKININIIFLILTILDFHF